MGLPAKRLERTFVTDSMAGGVCGGLAKYTGWDSNIWRLIWVLGTAFTGLVPGIIVYLAAWAIIPQE